MTVPWTWSSTTSRFSGRSVPETATVCRNAGLSGLEGGEHCFAGKTDAELDAIAATYREAGLSIPTFHLPFSPADDVANFYETLRRATVLKIRRWMERAARLGAGIGILHPSTNRCSVETEGLDRFLAAFGRSMAELLPAAEELGFTLAVENMLPGEGGRFGSHPEHFVLIRREFGHPRLRFCLDTGHALVSARERASDFFEAMGGDLAAFHLQDNPGDRDSHLAPGHGRVDWNAVFRGMAVLGFRGTACIEAVPFAFGPDYSPEAWRDMVRNTERLAEEALVSG